MRFNEKELSVIALQPCAFEGKLSFKTHHLEKHQEDTPKDRYFRLVGNCLFYFRCAASGIEKVPLGAIFLEHCEALQYTDNTFPFSFLLKFKLDRDKQYIFGCSSIQSVDKWVKTINSAGYDQLRNRYDFLKGHMESKTGVRPKLGLISETNNQESSESFTKYVNLIDLW